MRPVFCNIWASFLLLLIFPSFCVTEPLEKLHFVLDTSTGGCVQIPLNLEVGAMTRSWIQNLPQGRLEVGWGQADREGHWARRQHCRATAQRTPQLPS
jgi:hypothetical protein